MDWRNIIGRPAAAGAVSVIAGAAMFASPALASSSALPAPTATCPTPVLTQPFAGDSNWYFLAPGQTPDNFDGSGWTLSGGASLVTAKLQDGHSGQVLDLPSGASAVSPVICIATNFPVAKAMVRSISGPPGITFSITYLATGAKSKTLNVPSTNNWAASVPMNLTPSSATGWQLVRFTYHATGTSNRYQLYNLYVDPRCS